MKTINQPKKLIVHCSDFDQSHDVRDIHDWHKKRDFDGIGYHYIIDQQGYVHQGRPHYWQGAHTKGQNTDSLGICLLGKLDFHQRQFIALAGLIIILAANYDIELDKISPHGRWDKSKTCPNFCVASLYSEINHAAYEKIAVMLKNIKDGYSGLRPKIPSEMVNTLLDEIPPELHQQDGALYLTVIKAVT